jgi:adenine-specific DNA-methyltransferase
MKKISKKSEMEKLKSKIEWLEKELKKEKRYGLVWEEEKNPEDLVEICKEKLPVLKEIKNKEIIIDRNKSFNLLIEGDNYHALSVLNYTHARKVDIIYIDPPYNTGNKDFVFNDHYIDKEDAYRHSKWLSFMKKRLKLAKNLLKDTGIIFISIDDNEVAQLKLLMDNPDLFGENNFVAQFIWNKKTGRQNDARFVSTNHEYILCYFKDYNRGKVNLLPRTEELNKTYKNPDNDPRGPWSSVTLQAKSGTESSIYRVFFPNKIEWKPPRGTYPKFKKEKLLELYKDNRIWFGENGKNVPRLKKFLSEVQQGLVPNTLLLSSEVGSTQKAKEDYKRILPNINFDNPKPLQLIKYLTIMGGSKDSIILDFMAGSGTTGEAVLELNKDDNGNRQFILCTNNEKKIATNICYPRVKRAILGFKDRPPLGGNLKYFKAYFIDASPTDKNKKKLTTEATEMLCIKEGTFEKVLDRKDFKIFKNPDHYTGIIFDQTVIPTFKKTIKSMKGKFSVYVFSLGDETFEDEFADLNKKRSVAKSRTKFSSDAQIQLSPIPEAILRVYRRIFK